MKNENRDNDKALVEAKQLIAQEEQQKQEEFKKDIESVYRKHGYRLDVVSQLTINKI